MKNILICIALFCSGLIYSQDEGDGKFTDGLGLTVELGANTSMKNSVYSNIHFPKYSLGIVKMWKSDKKLQHGVDLRYNPMTSKFKNVPTSSSQTSDQRIHGSMVYLGWRGMMDIKESQFSALFGLGGNYILSETFYPDLSNRSTSWTLSNQIGSSLGFEISLGIGTTVEMGDMELLIAPRYHTVISGHTAHVFGLEAVFSL